MAEEVQAGTYDEWLALGHKGGFVVTAPPDKRGLYIAEKDAPWSPQVGGGLVVANLVNDYGLGIARTSAQNTAAVQQFFTDAVAARGQGIKLAGYTPAATDVYLVDTITLPPCPVTLLGDGPTASMWATINGTIVTYDPANPIPAGAAQPFSYLFGSQAGKGVGYQNNVWRIHGMGFAKNDGWAGNQGNGFYFPKWTAGNAYQQLQLWMSDTIISNFNGASGVHAGLYYIISGGITDSRFSNVVVADCAARGFYIGSDSRMVDVTAHSNGEEGFYCDSYIWQALGMKAWGNGQLKRAGKMSGIYMQGPPAGNHLTNLYLQDNNGPGITLHNSGRISIHGLSVDRNNWVEEASGILIQDSNRIWISGVDSVDSKNMPRTTVTGANGLNSATINVGSTAAGTFGAFAASGTVYIDNTAITYTGVTATSFTGCSAHPAYVGGEPVSQSGAQLHAVKVTNTGGVTNNSNKIAVNHNAYDVGYTVGPAVDPVSDLNGTNVTVGSSDGGEIALAFAAAVTPDPYLAQTQVVGTLTGPITINAPANAHKGCRLRFKFTQDGTGGRVITWNAIFKQAFVTTNNIAGKVTIVEFEYDGANWIQVNSNLWF